MNKKDMVDLAKWSIMYAKKIGSNEASVFISKTNKIEIEICKKKIEKLIESTQNSLNLSLYVDNRFSSHYTNRLRKEHLKNFIEKAYLKTKHLNIDTYRSLPDPELYKDQKKIDIIINDQSYKSIEYKKKVKIANDIEKSAMSKSNNIISVTSSFYGSHEEYVKFQSNGFIGEEESTIFSCSAEVTVNDNDRARPEDWSSANVRFFKDLPDPELIGKNAADRALRKIGQTKIKTGIYDMVVENRVSSKLIHTLYLPMKAKSIQQKKSFLENKINKKIASEKLTIYDNPFVIKGLGSRLFDSEGISAKKRIIIDRGILKSIYIDSYYGKKLKMTPTTGSFSNIALEKGTKSIENIIKTIKKGIMITEFLGGNSNSLTGDFSFGIVGLYIEHGKIIKPVNEMNITGNLETLWKHLYDVGNDPYIYSSLMIPTLYFKDMNFSGL